MLPTAQRLMADLDVPFGRDERENKVDILTIEHLVSGKDVFFAATGITNGALLRGVHYDGDGASTYSMVMRSRSGTVRYVEAHHEFEKLERFSTIAYRR